MLQSTFEVLAEMQLTGSQRLYFTTISTLTACVTLSPVTFLTSVGAGIGLGRFLVPHLCFVLLCDLRY